MSRGIDHCPTGYEKGVRNFQYSYEPHTTSKNRSKTNQIESLGFVFFERQVYVDGLRSGVTSDVVVKPIIDGWGV